MTWLRSIAGAYAERSGERHSGSDDAPRSADPLGDLSGPWRAHASRARPRQDVRRTRRSTTTSWTNVRVPHHWRAEPAFADSDGPLLYRRRFTHRTRPTGRRALPRVRRHLLLRRRVARRRLPRRDRRLVRPARVRRHRRDARARRPRARGRGRVPAATRPRRASARSPAPYWQSPLLDPDAESRRPLAAGAHRRRADRCGSRRMRVLCIEASVEHGRLACDLALDAGDDTARRAPARDRPRARRRRAARRVRATRRSPRARTSCRGRSPSTSRRAGGRARSARKHCATLELTRRGRRRGERPARRAAPRFAKCGGTARSSPSTASTVYLKGASYGPARALLGDADDALVRADVERALAANLDLLRVHTHVASAALYDAADETGLLLWQDFPMHGGYARGVRKQAARQARALVDLLGHHPSIFAVVRARRAARRRHRARRLVATATAPTWGKEVLDRSVARAITRARSVRGRSSAPRAAATTRTSGSDGCTASSPASRRPCARRAAARPVRVRVRRAIGSGDRGVDASRALARARLGRARRAPRHATRRVRRHACPLQRREVVRRVARRDAGVPGRAAAAADRGPPPLQGRTERRVRAVHARRSRARASASACSTTNASRSGRTRACATRAGRCCRWSIPAPATCTSSTTRHHARRGARSRSSVDGRARRWRGDVERRRDRVHRAASTSATPSTSKSRSRIPRPDAS